jgi:hypothetical protein
MVKLFKTSAELNYHLSDESDPYAPMLSWFLQFINISDEFLAEDPADIPRRSDGKVGITYKYRTNQLDITKDTFKEAIANKKYIKNECWINALYEIYGDSLLRTNKQQRYVITRAKILEIIGKTEDNIQEGITWKEILPFSSSMISKSEFLINT